MSVQRVVLSRGTFMELESSGNAAIWAALLSALVTECLVLSVNQSLMVSTRLN